MDMTISSQGSYDVALEMRDTTGAVFPQGKTPDCSVYSDPAALGVPEGTTIKAEPITGGADGAAGATPEAAAAPSGGQGEPQPSSTSFRGVVDTKVSVTFPGAVTQSGGGKVSGTTVTWDDPDTVAKGVSASGYAQNSRGVSWWSRSGIWLSAGLVAVGGALAAAVLRRRYTGRMSRQRRTRKD